MSPTQRTLAWVKKYCPQSIAQVVEHWNPHARIRQDLFGVFDILVVSPSQDESMCWGRIKAIQVTTRGNVSSRVKKIIGSDKARTWLSAGGEIEVWGWGKLKRGWSARVFVLDLKDGKIRSTNAGEVA